MIVLYFILAYMLVWTGASAYCMKFLSEQKGQCKRGDTGYKSICQKYHGVDHWEAPGVVEGQHIILGTLMGLFWPVVVVPVGAFSLATRTPKAKRINQEEIASLEAKVTDLKKKSLQADILRLEKECEIN